MNDRMALSLIASIMDWNDAKATEEYSWLRLMSAIKYDGYTDFRAGMRFIESLATWLKQFDAEDRAVAYEFVRNKIVYVSPQELYRIIDAFVPECVIPTILATVADELGIPSYEIWKHEDAAKVFKKRLRKTLFIGMSDGSRIDVLRRANSKLLSTEQVVPMMNIDPDKWRDLSDNLSSDLNTESGKEKFDRIYLIDDFTASGTTFIRYVDGKWKGKLAKFNKLVMKAREDVKEGFPIADKYTLHIHHYISSTQAHQSLEAKLKEADSAWQEKSYGQVAHTAGHILPPGTKLNPTADKKFLELCEKYYDHSLFTRLEKHCKENGQIDMRYGYANCALPVVLDHNTPNNSVSILWAETDGSEGRAMVPLFRRRDRHG